MMETGLYLLVMLGLAAAMTLALRRIERDFSGARGRPYAELCADLYRETERRGELIAHFVAGREERLAKLERR